MLDLQEETRIAENYFKIDSQRSGAHGLYALHELAHFVVLFRRPPQLLKAEIEDMNQCLDTMSPGRAQVHELRVIKLQHDVLGVSIESVLCSVWFGIQEAGEQVRRDRVVVPTKASALRRIRSTTVSPRLHHAYRRTIQRFSHV